MICYSKLFNKSRQISCLSKDSFMNFAVLICTFLFLDDKISINLLILGQVRYKYLATPRKREMQYTPSFLPSTAY